MVLEPESAKWIFKDPAYLHYVVKDGREGERLHIIVYMNIHLCQ